MLVNLICNDTYETHKVVTVNRKIITTSEKAEYYSVFVDVLKRSQRWRGWQQKGVKRGVGEEGQQRDAKPHWASDPVTGNSGAPRFHDLR